MKLMRYLIPQISAKSIISFARRKDDGYCFEFDPYEASQGYYVEKTYQDNCAMFEQAQEILKERGMYDHCGSESLYEIFVYIDFSGIFDRKPVGKTLEQQKIAEYMFGPEGISIYKQKGMSRYLAFERSASMSRSNVLAFVREDMYEPLRERMMLGMDIGQCQLSKLYAYNGLMFSSGSGCVGGDKLTSEGIVVVDNPKSIVRDTPIITVEDDGTKNAVRKYTRVEKTADIEVLEFDGEGIIANEFAPSPNDEENHNSFQIRLPYIKGVVHKVDIRKLLAELQVPFIRDIWGIEHDSKKIDMIITKSMFKGFGWMTENGLTWKQYIARCREYGHSMFVTGMDKPGKQETTELNYQFLNTLMASNDDFRPDDLPLGWTRSPKEDKRYWLAETTEEEYWSYANDMDFRYAKCREELETGGYSLPAKRRGLLRAIAKNPLFLEEPLIAREFEQHAESICNNYALGKLLIAGDNRYLSDDLIRLIAYVVKESIGEGKAYRRLEKEFLRGSEMYAPCPGYEEQEVYTLLRSPHISRNEEAIAYPLEDVGKLRKKYLSHLSYVLMVDSRSLIPERLGGADYDGDMVKTIADVLLNGCVKNNYDIYGTPPLLKIPSAEPLISDAKDLKARFETVKNTFSSRVGQISNAALRRGIVAYDENSDSAERDQARRDTEVLAILTGLEIDSAKSGIKPDLSEYLEKRKGKKSLFLRYKNIVGDEDDREWYQPTTEKRIKEFIESVKWDKVTSYLEKLPYYARMLRRETVKHEPSPAPDEKLFAFAADPDWKEKLDPYIMERTRAVTAAYHEAISRMRYLRHIPKDLKRRRDIERILFARGQENEYSVDSLYALLDYTEPSDVRRARAMLSEMNWHLLPMEERLLAIYDFKISSLSFHKELFCDFRCGGYRLLGDLICDIDDLNRSREIEKRIIRKGDTADLRQLLTGVRLHGDYESDIAMNCMMLMNSKIVGREKLDMDEVLKCAIALGEREFALRVLPSYVGEHALNTISETSGRKKK